MQEENLKIDEVTINYIHGGQGDILILFPGWPGNFSVNDKDLEFFSRYFEVFAVNIPGFGKSGAINDGPTLNKLMAVITEFIKKKGLNKYSLVGFSYGGMIALKLASLHPEKVNRLIVAAPLINFRYFELKTQFIIRLLISLRSVLTKFIPQIIKNDRIVNKFYYFISNYHYKSGDLEDYNRNVANIRAMNVNSCIDMFAFLPGVNLLSDLKSVKAKTLMLYGKRDDFMIDYSREVGNAMPNFDLKCIDCEHWDIILEYGSDNLVKFLKE
ncbi:hypothetical protein A2872_02850 [Candidatus Gottesmanbacteria bacterium RIFCSPHIGHO2_01_FULL_42_12]|uniref:AB hydrolase-1 domain-containing protein n=1 Tax=Candidatus Gottesmanbacteria bacterium RIFCSPHIGHO2_01_FULL_42_12 TaxID=1798377 RepID=A0A1F5Z3W3_9BACT|nr:MAG: hypothetical protein A2872_02850 [Candidatus Gottesmanbacteria bacterium RIFCSPHIGHO2_01_FULL_42_12]